MYEYIRGEVTEYGDQYLILDNGGVGYRMAVSPETAARLSEEEGPVTVYIHLSHREDSMELFGFSGPLERTVFRELLTLSGVGPKQAMKFLSGMPLASFVQAVRDGDISALTAVPGLGKKRAEKIAFELKDRLDGILPDEGQGPVSPSAIPADAVLALEALGFSGMMARAAVKKAVEEAGESAETQDLVRAALRHV